MWKNGNPIVSSRLQTRSWILLITIVAFHRCMQKGCDKKFFSSHMMHAHLKVHMRRKEIVCEFEGCGKIFDKQCRLKQHMRSHTGEKPYICSVEVIVLSIDVCAFM